jgi:hypothetical protein
LADSRRRGLPDNLDPLVDTLSNVVGILIVVVALTQLQVGDALERVIQLGAAAGSSVSGPEAALEASRTDVESRLEAARLRRETVLARSDGDLRDAIAAAEKALAALQEMKSSTPTAPPERLRDLESAYQARSRELESVRAALDQRGEYANEIREVPREIVARLPDPGVLTGEEGWILCRYGRCYLTDRTRLVEAGSNAIGRILEHNSERGIRPDEFESVSHHFRKRDIGYGDFRWQVVVDPNARARVEWRTRDNGIERTRIANSPALRAWLRDRSPERDFIRFQVWNDSFEVYLAAREAIEAAGFRAGWSGYGDDEELDLYLTFGPPPAREGPVEVD